MDDITLTLTQKGSVKLAFNGYLYNKVATNATAIRFRCERFQGDKCPGRLYTNLGKNEVVSNSIHASASQTHSHGIVKGILNWTFSRGLDEILLIGIPTKWE